MAKIAIVGSGISGLTCVNLLKGNHELTLYESGPVLGGHTATVDVVVDDNSYAIDTGFIVFNNRTYPNFNKLLKKIGIPRQETEMSFSVSHEGSGIEYNGHNISSLFAQRENLFSPRFYHFIYEILTFNRMSKHLYANGVKQKITLSLFLEENGFSDFFAEHYILPMVSAIWSSSIEESRLMPLDFFLRFFCNHGLLDVSNRPQWYVIPGGSRNYIPRLLGDFSNIRLATPVTGVSRSNNNISVKTATDETLYDEVILACHSDDALQLLTDSSEDERRILGAIKYRDNDVVLHTDTDMLPTNRRAWASWNYRLASGALSSAPAVTYNMNILQGLAVSTTFCVTLNQSKHIDKHKILQSFVYSHPIMDNLTLAAQKQRDLICGHNHTHFCGAYWYNGFHEDGVNSALDVCRRFGGSL